MADTVYTDKSFVKLTLNNKILRGNDKLHPADLTNWRKIFAGNGESYVNKEGKTVKLNSLIGIEIVEYDKTKATGQKTGRSLEYNLTPANIAMIIKNIERALNFDGVLFSDVKTHAFVKNNAGKGEVSYAGVRLNDIRIFDDLFGNTLVEFPTREFTNKQGETKNVAVFYPVGEYKTAINNVILECYKDILQKDGPVFSLLRKDSVVKGKKRTSSKKSVSVNATEPVEAAETAPVAENEETAVEEQEVA